jgi:hypothetical protein
METNANSNLIELNVVRKSARLQNNRKSPDLEGEESKAHAYMALAWQVSSLMLGCLLMAQEDYFHGALGFSVGLIVGIGQSLSIWTKIHPSKLFMGFLLGVALAGLFSALGVFVSF